MFAIDRRRIHKFEKMTKDKIDSNVDVYNDHIIKFIYGKEVEKRPLAECKDKIERLNGSPGLKKIFENKQRTLDFYRTYFFSQTV